MIDKVDRPEPPAYRVHAAAEAKGGQQGGQEERRDEDEYSASSAEKKWQKYHTDAKDRKALKLRKRDILELFFSQTVLQKGLVIIEADILLINNQILKNAHLFSTKIDTYWKLKKLNKGDKIPLDELISSEYLEISVPQKQEQKEAPEKETLKNTRVEQSKQGGLKPWTLIDEKTGKLNFIALTLFGSLIILLIIAMLLLIGL